MAENSIRSGRNPVPEPAELLDRQEAAGLSLGHQRSTCATETAPECGYEIGDEDNNACSTNEDYTNVQSRQSRSSLVLVLAVLGLAILGGAGTFGFRAIIGGPVPPTPAPIGKANKTAPVSSAVTEAKNATKTNQAGITTTGSSESPVSREEQAGKPRVIRTIPITPDEGWRRGAAALAPADVVQMASDQATPGAVVSVWPPPPAMAAPTAPTAAATIPAPPAKVLSEPKMIHMGTNRADQSGAADARPEPPSPAAPIALGDPNSAAPEAPYVSGGGYAVQVTSERSESNAQAALQTLQVKYPNQLRGRQPIIRRFDLGAKGIYYRVLVGPFASADEAAGLCSRLKAAGGNCIVQRN